MKKIAIIVIYIMMILCCVGVGLNTHYVQACDLPTQGAQLPEPTDC